MLAKQRSRIPARYESNQGEVILAKQATQRRVHTHNAPYFEITLVAVTPLYSIGHYTTQTDLHQHHL